MRHRWLLVSLIALAACGNPQTAPNDDTLDLPLGDERAAPEHRGVLTAAATTGDNPVVVENRNAGSTAWQLDYPYSEDPVGQMEGYASSTSVNKGFAINLMVSTNPPQKYSISVYRLGWYGGKGGRLMRTVSNLSGTKQAACPMNASTGLVECKWQVSHKLSVPTTWTSGIYIAKLVNAAGYNGRIMFVVRDDGRVADFTYQQPVTTYQAYNAWPEGTSTGKSLYSYNSSGPVTASGETRAVKVSFDRPGFGQYGNRVGEGNYNWEQYLVRWLERNGYDIQYTTDIDTHAEGWRAYRNKGLIVAGHDEYYTKAMYDTVEDLRDSGISLAFMGANAMYWQIRLEPNSSGAANRTIVCYKDAAKDPNPTTALKTVRWRDVGRPEQQVIGVMFTAYSPNAGIDKQPPFVVRNALEFIYGGSNLLENAAVKGLEGYEIDRIFPDFKGPADYRDISYFKTLGRSKFTNDEGAEDYSEATLYQNNFQNWVFASGTMSWAWGLDRAGAVNTGIQQLTKNVLDTMIGKLSNAQLKRSIGPSSEATDAPSPTRLIGLPPQPPREAPGER